MHRIPGIKPSLASDWYPSDVFNGLFLSGLPLRVHKLPVSGPNRGGTSATRQRAQIQCADPCCPNPLARYPPLDLVPDACMEPISVASEKEVPFLFASWVDPSSEAWLGGADGPDLAPYLYPARHPAQLAAWLRGLQQMGADLRTADVALVWDGYVRQQELVWSDPLARLADRVAFLFIWAYAAAHPPGR